MNKLSRYVLLSSSLAVIFCLVLLVVVPYIQMAWALLFPSYGYKVAVLPFDIECRCDSALGSSKPIVLPKGLMIYSPCSHDFSRMSLDENATCKIYLKLDAKTMSALYKDSDKEQRKLFLDAKRFGELEECPTVDSLL